MGMLFNNIGSAYKVAEKWQDAREWLGKSLTYNREINGDRASVLGYTQGIFVKCIPPSGTPSRH